MKVGFIFAGQGAQYSGMGKDLYENYNSAREIFNLAGEEVKKWCFEGSEEELKLTHITQPCVYTVTMAAYNAFLEKAREENLLDKLEIFGLAGFSLGEYSALTAAGSIADIRTGMDIVTKRGTWMNEAGLDENGVQQGSMVAAIGEREKILQCVEAVREDGILEGVNFNSPVQTVVAGDKESLERFKAEAKERKIKAIPLNVGTAFHSQMMESAADKLKDLLLSCELSSPEMAVYSDVTAKDIREGLTENMSKSEVNEYMAELESRQAKSPVYWQEIIENMIANGVEAFIEFGPGSTLTGINKKINKNILSMAVQDKEGLETAISTLKEAVC